jgi:hypothetical protein
MAQRGTEKAAHQAPRVHVGAQPHELAHSINVTSAGRLVECARSELSQAALCIVLRRRSGSLTLSNSSYSLLAKSAPAATRRLTSTTLPTSTARHSCNARSTAHVTLNNASQPLRAARATCSFSDAAMPAARQQERGSNASAWPGYTRHRSCHATFPGVNCPEPGGCLGVAPSPAPPFRALLATVCPSRPLSSTHALLPMKFLEVCVAAGTRAARRGGRAPDDALLEQAC